MKTNRTTSASRRIFALAAVLLALAPGRAAADPAAIFVSNYNAGGTPDVPAFSTSGAAATGYTTPTNFSTPEGVAYNPANNTIYVADIITSQVRTFNATTGVETTASTGFANAAGLNGPAGLALNAGVLYVANSQANTISAYNAATGAAASGITSPTGLSNPFGLAVNNTTLYVASGNSNGAVSAYNRTTGTGMLGFTAITGSNPYGLALFGNDLFVTNSSSGTVGEYNATSGAVINANFVTGLGNAGGLSVLGNQLLVLQNNTVGAYGIPAMATNGNVPTSSNPNFITGLSAPDFLAAVNVVPEPSTWALLGVGAIGLGLTLRQRRARLG